MTLATNVLVLTAWLAAAGFLGRFLLTTWYRRTAGVVTTALVAAAFAVLSLAGLGTILGQDWPGRALVRLAVYGLLNVLLWAGLVVMLRDQYRSRVRSD